MARPLNFLGLLICVLVLATSQATASAQSYSIPDGASFAVTSQFLYWERWSPRSCRGCGELWRMPVAGGRHQLVDRVRKGQIGHLAGGDDVLAYTTMQDGAKYRTEVRAITDDGQRGTLARATYRKNSRKNCGSQVSSGAVSADGEVAWQKLDVRSPAYGCHQLYGRLRWSAYSGALGTSARMILSPRSREINLFEAGGYLDILEWISPVVAFEGQTLLAGAPFGSLEIHRVPDGAMVRIASEPNVAFSGLADLATNGAVFADLILFEPDGGSDWGESPLLFPQPDAWDRRVDLTIKGQGLPTAAHFCAGQLVQVTSAKNRLQMTRRSLDGTILSSRDILSGASEYETWFDCNANHAVIQYEAWNQSTKKGASGTIGVSLID